MGSNIQSNLASVRAPGFKVFSVFPRWTSALMLSAQEWHNATAVAKAYAIGKGEAGRFLTHEMIAKGLFSTGFSSGSGFAEAWNHQLINKHDGELEPKRMIISFWLVIDLVQEA